VTAGVPGLGLSGLFVMLSVIVMPAWRTKHRARAQVRPVRVLPLLAIATAIAATTWLTWEAVSLGLHHASTGSTGSTRPHGHASFIVSFFGVPVILISLAILIAVVGLAELLAHTVEARPTPTAPAVQRISRTIAPPADSVLTRLAPTGQDRQSEGVYPPKPTRARVA